MKGFGPVNAARVTRGHFNPFRIFTKELSFSFPSLPLLCPFCKLTAINRSVCTREREFLIAKAQMRADYGVCLVSLPIGSLHTRHSGVPSLDL